MNSLEQLKKEVTEFEESYNMVIKRNTWTPNDILLYGDHAELILRDNRQNINGITFIDLADVDLVKKYKWSNMKGYARTTTKGKTIRLARLLMGEPKLQVDHINHIKLDNRRKNLRIVTQLENSRNKTPVSERPQRIFRINKCANRGNKNVQKIVSENKVSNLVMKKSKIKESG